MQANELEMAETPTMSASTTPLVVCLGPWYEDAPAEHLQPLLHTLGSVLRDSGLAVHIVYPASGADAPPWEQDGATLQPYVPSAKLHELSVQTATTFLHLYEAMQAQGAAHGLLLGADADQLQPSALRAMVQAVTQNGDDLVVPCYEVRPNEGLINAAILYPLSRALFSARVQFPLALDLAMSRRMAERMAAAAQRLTASSHAEALLWPVAEAAAAGFSMAQVSAGERPLPRPGNSDLSSILNTVATSLFLDIESKATYWQRTRPPVSVRTIDAVLPTPPDAETADLSEIEELVESFRIGYGNLHELWSLVLPPQTLLGLKQLSRLPLEAFSLPDSLWVRILYDFVLAHRLRTINRGHLMGSLTPLYLAWVASHLLTSRSTTHGNGAESLARAFEADKPYLVSRWRWPDRFNP